MRTLALLPLAGSLLLLGLSSCMTSVTNGSSVCGTDAELSLSGYAVAPGQQVFVEASSSASGAFGRVADVRAADKPLTLSDGTKLYAWSAKARVRAWSAPSGGKRSTYVRAYQVLDGGVVFPYYTFDANSPWMSCFQNAMSRGTSAKDAVELCKSPSSPVARVEAPELSSCPVARRSWQKECDGAGGAVTPQGYLFTRGEQSLRCATLAPVGSGWTITDAVSGVPAAACFARWTATHAPRNADLDDLQSWSFRNTLHASCAPASPVCAKGTCPQISGAVAPSGNRNQINSEITSGCPKCGVTSNGSTFVVLPPSWVNTPLSLIVANTTRTVAFDPAGRQLIELPAMGTAALGVPDGTTFPVVTTAALVAANKERDDFICKNGGACRP